MFFTGAYRRPRRINWLIGLIAAAPGRLQRRSWATRCPTTCSRAPACASPTRSPSRSRSSGPSLASLLFGGEFPTSGIIARIYPVHIFLLPAAHRRPARAAPGHALAAAAHASSPAPGRDDRTVVGTPMVPAYALRTTGYFLLVAGVLTAFGALAADQPGVALRARTRPGTPPRRRSPTGTWAGSRARVRLFPGWDIQIGGFLLPAVFWPAVVLPGLIFTPLFLWPWLDGMALRDDAFHNVLDAAARASRADGDRRRASSPSSRVLLVAGGDDVFASVLRASSLPALLRDAAGARHRAAAAGGRCSRTSSSAGGRSGGWRRRR